MRGGCGLSPADQGEGATSGEEGAIFRITEVLAAIFQKGAAVTGEGFQLHVKAFLGEARPCDG